MRLLNPLRLCPIGVVLISMLFGGMSASAQDTQPEIPRPIYTLQDGIVSQLAINEQTLTPVADLHTGLAAGNATPTEELFPIRRVYLTETPAYIYRIEVLSTNHRKRSMHNRVVRVDLQTNEQTILMERADIYVFQPSPTGDRAFVIYMEGGDRGRSIPCIFDMRSLECQPLDFIAPPGAHYTVWLDEETIALRASPNVDTSVGIMLINALTLETSFIRLPDNVFFISFTPIPGTREFMLSANSYDAPSMTPVQFYSLNIDTQVIQDFAYDAVFDRSILGGNTVTAWLFSPDKRYLLYGNWGQLGAMVLTEFETGRIVGVFPEVTQASWLTSDRLLILNSYSEQPTLSEVNAVSGEMKTVIADAAGIVILN